MKSNEPMWLDKNKVTLPEEQRVKVTDQVTFDVIRDSQGKVDVFDIVVEATEMCAPFEIVQDKLLLGLSRTTAVNLALRILEAAGHVDYRQGEKETAYQSSVIATATLPIYKSF